MFGRLRRWWRARPRPIHPAEWGPGIHLLPEVKADPNVLPPSAAITSSPAKTITINVDIDVAKLAEAIRRYERYNAS